MPKYSTIPEVIESYQARFLPEEAKGSLPMATKFQTMSQRGGH